MGEPSNGDAFGPGYPEGNFEGNQLLGGSIGLSPLCHAQATQFARQNSDRPPPRFPRASPWNGIVHHLSGPMEDAFTQNPVHWTSGPVPRAGRAPPPGGGGPVVRGGGGGHSFALTGPFRSRGDGPPANGRTPVDSLVRVSRRAVQGTVRQGGCFNSGSAAAVWVDPSHCCLLCVAPGTGRGTGATGRGPPASGGAAPNPATPAPENPSSWKSEAKRS